MIRVYIIKGHWTNTDRAVKKCLAIWHNGIDKNIHVRDDLARVFEVTIQSAFIFFLFLIFFFLSL